LNKSQRIFDFWLFIRSAFDLNTMSIMEFSLLKNPINSALASQLQMCEFSSNTACESWCLRRKYLPKQRSIRFNNSGLLTEGFRQSSPRCREGWLCSTRYCCAVRYCFNYFVFFVLHHPWVSQVFFTEVEPVFRRRNMTSFVNHHPFSRDEVRESEDLFAKAHKDKQTPAKRCFLENSQRLVSFHRVVGELTDYMHKTRRRIDLRRRWIDRRRNDT